MLTKISIAAIILIIFVQAGTSQAPTSENSSVPEIGPVSDEYIDWSAERKLSWEDYLGPADENSDAAATTSTALGIEYNFRNGILTHNIYCRFSRLKSWGRYRTEYILAHEQAHFDITEIFARKLHKAMLEYRFNRATYRSDLSKIYNSIVQEKQEFQERYDKETDHSRRKWEQKEWQRYIGELLVDYEAWKQY